MNSIQRQIQPLNHHIEYIVNSIQNRFNSQSQKWAKTHSTLKATNGIQRQFQSKTDSIIKPSNRIQREFLSKTDSTTQIGFNVKSI